MLDLTPFTSAEQNGMNRNGGLGNLDNKRNEIKEPDWSKYGVKPAKNGY
ncbi:MAG: hypothetical protein ABL856_12375 [Gallionella sp.]